MCATYRFEGGATKLRVTIRTTEGDYGDIRLTVVAKIPPKKSAQVIRIYGIVGKWCGVVWCGTVRYGKLYDMVYRGTTYGKWYRHGHKVLNTIVWWYVLRDT